MVFGQVYRPASKSPAPPPPPPLAAPPPPPKAPSPKAPAASTLKKPSLAKLGGQATDADRGELLKALNSGEAARARLRPTQTRDKSAPAVTAEIEEEKPAVPPPRVVTTPAPPPPPPPTGIAPPPPPPAVRKPSPGPPKNSALAKLGGQASDADRGALLKALNGPVRLRPTQTVDKSAPVVTAEIEEKEGGVRLRVDEAVRSGAATPNSMDGSLAGSRNSLDSQGASSPTKKKTAGKKKIVKKATPGAPPPPPLAPPPPTAVRKASPTPLNPSLSKLGGQATDADRGALLKALNTGGVRAGLRPTQTVDKSAPVVKAEIEEGVSDKEALETLKKSTAASEAAPASPKKLTRQYTNKTSLKSAPPPAPAPPPPPMAPPVDHVRKTSPAPKNAAALSKLGGKATDADRGELLKSLNTGGARAGLRPTQTVDKSAPVVTAQIEEGTSTKEALEKLKNLPADSTTAKTTSIYSGAPKRTSVPESPKKTTATTETSKKPAPLDIAKKTVVSELAKKEITEVPPSPRGKKGGVSSAIKMFTTPASPVKKTAPPGVRKAIITDVTTKATEPTEPPPKKTTTTTTAAAKVANGTSTTAAAKPATNGTTAPKAENGTKAPRKLATFGAWEQKESAKGRIYYWNNNTKKSQWTRPVEWPAPKKAGLKKQATIEKKRATLKKQATIEEKKKKFLLHRGESEWDELEELLNGVDTNELDLEDILNDGASDDD